MRRPVLAVLGIALAGIVEVSCVPPADPAHGARPVASGTAGARPEDAWLASIGTGAAQTARVCQRGGRDRVTSVLCSSTASSIRSLEDLYRALGFGEPAQRNVAATIQSLGLSARIVTAANPRTFVLPFETAPIPSERLVVTGFTRGEQLVELAALDAVTLDYTFYLLKFEQACNRTRCGPEDLLTEKIERDWTGFTLYADRDLEDTALDCLSCHQPFGSKTHKQLLMRQTGMPWLHWADFRGISENRVCVERVPEPGGTIPGDGLDLLLALEGRAGRHAGIPVAELAVAPSGERFSLFLTDAENTIRNSAYPAGYPYAQLDFDSAATLCERFRTGQSPTWEHARTSSLARGLLVPFYTYDAMDAAKRAELAADRSGFFSRHAADKPFELAMSLVSAEATTAVGFVPRPDDTVPQMLRAMCIRCHDASTDTRFRRARFNAELVDRFEPELAGAIRNRITMARTDPGLMPPLRVGELPPWAIARISEYLREHCSVPGGCDGD